VLRLEPGREEDAGFWLQSLSVNRAIMQALEEQNSLPCPGIRHELGAIKARRRGHPEGHGC